MKNSYVLLGMLAVGAYCAYEGHRRAKILGPGGGGAEAEPLRTAKLMQWGGAAAAGGALLMLAG